MLKFTDAQLHSFGIAGHSPYLRRVRNRFRSDFEAEFADWTDEEMDTRIRSAFLRMREYRFERKEHLYRLILLDLLYGAEFPAKLPLHVQRLAFPKPGDNLAEEGERFWTVYRAADHLSTHPSKPLNQVNGWEEQE